MQKLRRAVSVTELLNKKFIDIAFEGKFKASFGQPERSGVWIVWGKSGNGKTDFCIKLSKELTKSGKVAYNALEEGVRKSIQQAVKRNNMKEVKDRFLILDRFELAELVSYLNKRRSADIIVIDSIQMSELTKSTYKKLKRDFPKKLFIFVSHAEGRNPLGRFADFVRYDSDLKIRVEGYKAFNTSRLGGGEPFVIWEEQAAKYWSDIG